MASLVDMPTTRVTLVTVVDDATRDDKLRSTRQALDVMETVHARANIAAKHVHVLRVPASQIAQRVLAIRAAMALKGNTPSRTNVDVSRVTFPCVFFNAYAVGGVKEIEYMIKMDGVAALARAALATNDDVFDASSGALDVFNRAFVDGDVVDGETYARSARSAMMMSRSRSRSRAARDSRETLNNVDTPEDVTTVSMSALRPPVDVIGVVDELLTLLRTTDDANGDEDALTLLKQRCAHVASRFQSAPPLDEIVDEDARKAFLLNLYNALVKHAKLVCGAPMNSRAARARFYRDIGYDIGGEFFALDDVEHGLLRGDAPHPSSGVLSRIIFGWRSNGGSRKYFPKGDARARASMRTCDARIHFALNCGATSCPPVRMYAAAKVNAQLDLAARAFINDTTRVREIKPGQYTVEMSKLFKWYAGDFTDDGRGRARDLLRFVAQFLHDDGAMSRALEDLTTAWRITYAPYDWTMT